MREVSLTFHRRRGRGGTVLPLPPSPLSFCSSKPPGNVKPANRLGRPAGVEEPESRRMIGFGMIRFVGSIVLVLLLLLLIL